MGKRRLFRTGRANRRSSCLPAQEQALWEEIIEASPWGAQLLTPARASAQCRDAWRLAHAWRIEGALEMFPGNDDARAFAEWARAYVKRTGATSMARVCPTSLRKLLMSPAIAQAARC